MAAAKPDDVLIPLRPGDDDGYAVEITDGTVRVWGCDCAQDIEDVDTAERIAAAITAWVRWKRTQLDHE
ncbi:hypothetical protein [Nocardia asiatica]|uniref:hypothetical protein n=1 Tax=Nocardia asiatica TaxID=209252 RepID=UPI00245491C7|nr:hypothetical protein [Nocardia asiatica]